MALVLLAADDLRRFVVPSTLADELPASLDVFLGPLAPAGFFSLLLAAGTGRW